VRHSIIEQDLQAIAAEDLPWSEFEGRTVLITGANGFLPAYMVEMLLYLNETRFQRPVQVLALVRNHSKAVARFASYHGRDDLHFLVQDVCEPPAVERHIDFVIHAASQASPKYFGVDPAGTLTPNVLGTYHALCLAHEHAAKGFLFFSSGEVYGEVNPAHVPTREDQYGYVDPTRVRSCYAESKRLGETMCVAWHQQYGVPAKIVRPFHTYGPGMALDDGRVFADFVANVLAGRDIVMKSDGSARRAFCYLADATAGFFTVLLKGKPGEAYNVGNEDQESSIYELARTLVGLFPEANLRVERQIRAHAQAYLQSPISCNAPDTTKARGLGWRPRTSIADGFRRTVLSFQ
jgi:nucleoside-diphosphate-sugar epimerase